MKKKHQFFLATTLMALALTGCSMAKNDADQPLVLKTASMFGQGDAANEPYLNLIANFRQSNPLITVEDESEISTEEWKTKIVQRFAEPDTTPDVLFYFTGADVKSLILAEQFVSVEEIREVYPSYADNIRPSTMDFMQEFDTNHYAVPVKGFWEGLFCNKDLFDRYNLPLPTTWNNLLNAIEVFNENGITPISASISEVPHYWIEHSILAHGGYIQHKLNPSGYLPTSWVDGMTELKNLYDSNAFAPDALTILNQQAVERFVNKEAAMLLEGSWTSSAIMDKEHTVVLPIPNANAGRKDPSDIISGYSTGYYISRNAWNDPQKREAAVKFVQHMTTTENIAYFCTFGGAPAADIAASSNPTPFSESEALLQGNAQHVNMPVDSRLNKESWQYLCLQIKPMMEGSITPQQVMTQVTSLNKW